jgi:hypothetical protein
MSSTSPSDIQHQNHPTACHYALCRPLVAVVLQEEEDHPISYDAEIISQLRKMYMPA